MRLWINRGFSIRELAPMMLAADPDLELFMSERQLPAVSRRVTGLPEPESVAEVAQIVAERKIDKVWPQRRHALFADALGPERLELPAGTDALATIASKADFATTLANWADDSALPTERFATLAEFDAATARFAPFGSLCVKPEIGVFGHGFWQLVPGTALSQLAEPDRREIDPAAFRWLVAEAERSGTLIPHVLMPWLPGPEVSIDLLMWRGEVLHGVARTKTDIGVQHIANDHAMLPHAAMLAGRFGLNGLASIQYRKAVDGSWRVLEINPRAAGGIVNSELAGARLVESWTRLLTGRLKPAEVPRPSIDAIVQVGERRELAIPVQVAA
ncbi:ATP-grasp domain-containing protein [Sphingomonas rustica]